MVERTRALLSAALIAAMTAAGCYALAVLPVDSQVPVHFGLNGQPDDWDSVFPGVFVMPGIAMLAWVLAAVLPRIDPRGANLIRSKRAVRTIMLAVTCFCAVLQAEVIACGFHHRPFSFSLITAASGGLLIAIGNVLGKLQWNYTVGLRTPWTLADERVWDATHRFAGWAMVIAGLIVLCSTPFLRSGMLGTALFATALLTATLLSIAKSYLLWRNRQSAPG